MIGTTEAKTTVLHRLRSETHASHLRIEESIGLQRPAFDLNNLRTLLIGFYSFHRAWEPLIASALADDGQWFDERRKLLLLEADLRSLEIDPHDPAMPVCTRLPALSDRIDALGSLYVLEGSTLGGQLVGRTLSQQLSLRDGRGYSYFLSYGANVGPMWRQFTERLLREIPDAGSRDGDRVVAAATETFERLTDWLIAVRNTERCSVDVRGVIQEIS